MQWAGKKALKSVVRGENMLNSFIWFHTDSLRHSQILCVPALGTDLSCGFKADTHLAWISKCVYILPIHLCVWNFMVIMSVTKPVCAYYHLTHGRVTAHSLVFSDSWVIAAKVKPHFKTNSEGNRRLPLFSYIPLLYQTHEQSNNPLVCYLFTCLHSYTPSAVVICALTYHTDHIICCTWKNDLDKLWRW